MQPEVTIIVSTRNRPEHVTACLDSILANTGVDFEVVVVDQSDKPDSHVAAERACNDPRLRWIETNTRGLSTSRNIGLAAVRAPTVAFTDDDCRVPTDWAASIASMFAADPDLTMLFGAVLLRPEDRAEGYAAEFEPAELREMRYTLPSMRTQWGVGANMAVRRSAFNLIGTFDPLLGAGARFFSAEEIDMTIRVLTAGMKVVHTPDISVLHLGIRRGEEASHLMRGYGIGLGATFSKHIRLRTPGSARALAQWLYLHGQRSVRNALRGDPHPGFGLVASVVKGACSSLRFPLDTLRSTYA